jgi:hypothetical protein
MAASEGARTSRRWVADAIAAGGLTAAAATAFLVTHPPLYNPAGSVDPWLYTALWTNFDQIYHSFAGTYYVSRLPWIVPGYVLNSVFDPRTASVILHASYFFAGGVLFFLLCRRWLGPVAAAAGYLALIGSQMYFDAHRWDYQEGGVLTYLIGTYALTLARTKAPALRAGSLFLGGAFAAALVTTRIFDAAYLIGLPLLYVAVLPNVPRGRRLLQLLRDAAAFAGGVAALLLAGGLFSRAEGTEFWFFMPQVRVLLATTGGYNQFPIDLWLPTATYFWIPIFAVAFAAAILLLGPRTDQLPRRFLAAAAIWITLDFVPFALWQFLGRGWLFNLDYYFSSFLVPTLLTVAAGAAVLVGTAPFSRRSLPLVIASGAAILGPLLWIYTDDSSARTATGYWDGAYVATFVAMIVAIVLVVSARLARLRVLGAAAVAVALFATS